MEIREFIEERLSELNSLSHLSEFQQGQQSAYLNILQFLHSSEDHSDTNHYLHIIQHYLQKQNMMQNNLIPSALVARRNGKSFDLSDHIKGMVYSLLSNQRSWAGIAVRLREIDIIFFNYNPQKILETSPEYFVQALQRIKCGNRAIHRQMQYLSANIHIFEQLIQKYGSMDAFVLSAPAYKIVEILSSQKSTYKLYNMGEALVWEYLRNVGIDGAKPDVHLCRFLGNSRMGKGNHDPATVEEVYASVESLSAETGFCMSEIDSLIWLYCATGYGDMCGAVPRCYICPIRNGCNNGRQK